MSIHRKSIVAALSLALALSFLAAGGASAATYYVSNSGSDSSAGSQAAPWQTLQKAAASISAGDVVLVSPGTYVGFNITSGGTSSSPKTFRADGDNVIINSQNASTPDNINIENADYVVVEGFVVQDAPRAGIRVATSRGVVLRNNYVHRCARWGIFTAYATDIQILDNVCANSGEEHGIYVSNSTVASDNPVIRGNECFGNLHNGIQLNGDCTSSGDGVISGALIENNIIHDNGWKGFSLISVQNSTIQNNILYYNGTAAGAGGIHLTDEPGCNRPSNNNIVVNNTVVEFNIAGIRIGDGSTANILFNNIVAASSLGSTIIDDVGGNQIHGTSNLRVTSTAGLFVDAAARDYHLASASAAVDVGVATYGGASAPTVDFAAAARPAGNGYDAGAFERAGAAPPPPPPPPPPTGIIATHPRILVPGGRLAELRQSGCFDASGNPIPGCTQTAQWNGLEDIVENRPERASALEWAMAFMVTGNATYRTNAIADADAQVAAGVDPIVAANYRFLYVRDYLRRIACTYDWLYGDLSAAQRTNYKNYMLMLIYLTWNDDATTKAIYDIGNWGANAPGNNFYYNFILATAYAALALHGENTTQFTWGGTTYPFKLTLDGVDYTNILDFLYAKITDESIPKWLNTYGKGGGWHEGDQYGPSAKRHLFEALVILRRAGGRDFFNDPATSFPLEAALYKFYSTQPRGRLFYSGGDAGREPTFGIYDYDRHEMICLADGLEGRAESAYAQYWVNHFYPLADGTGQQVVDFMFYRPVLPESPLSALPLNYRAEGMDWMNSRSSWGDDAVSVSFVSTDAVAGHQHNDQNAFQIYRGSSGSRLDGWLVTDTQPFATGNRTATASHNTIIVDNATCQRYGRGTGNMEKYSAVMNTSPAYVYTMGDASDAYYDDLEVNCYSQDGTKQLTTFQRELVHVLPGYIVVFDRVTPINPNAKVRNFFHYSNQPVVTGDMLEVTRGDGKVFHKVLLPNNARLTTIDEQIGDSKTITTWRLEAEATPVPNHQFLNVFYVTSAGTVQMPDALVVRSEQQNMVGTRIADPAHDIVLMFSADPTGAAPGGTIEYKVGFSNGSQHFLYDLVPGTEYTVDVAQENGFFSVKVAQGPGVMTTDAGVLHFEIDAVNLAALGR
ncbi:MAG: right-handed parallel beta-helix repeat-containing protein [Candidatus Krumholzibacteria bacterium]|nr:right-handed parallel beta-helix repeat-containing protein [Candidatus Krumholzibacteria bacterium]MDH4336467.1 right-handed parallel beta-helix repeat-containing protein [Candidatus Krumholzibacteria bacterium]MDH5269059.1 right-handed parallel beta-helix repeat-containing protein [Candidatus Krumholzibacteria bacterium]